MSIALGLALFIFAAAAAADGLTPRLDPLIRQSLKQGLIHFLDDPACFAAQKNASARSADLFRPLPECWLVFAAQVEPKPGANFSLRVE